MATSAQRCSNRSVWAVVELCVGGRGSLTSPCERGGMLCKRTKKNQKQDKNIQRGFASRRRLGSCPDERSGGLCRRSNGPALERFLSDCSLGRGHSFISDIYSWTPRPTPPQPNPTPSALPLQRPLGSQTALRPPPASLEKPSASDSH